MVFREKDIGFSESLFSVPEFSEFSIFRARVFRAGAKIGRGWGHAMHVANGKHYVCDCFSDIDRH